MTGERILIVVFEDGGLTPYAAAFSDKGQAEAFAAKVDGAIIDTTIDAHVTEDESNG